MTASASAGAGEGEGAGQGAVPAAGAEARPAVPEAANPFKGLEPFSDGDRLFGREADLVLMRNRIFSAPVTLLYARSGAGKTSFLEALLVPDLRDRYGDAYRIVTHRDWRGDAPVVALRAAFGLAADQPVSAHVAGSGQPWIVVLDQFEELFQTGSSWRGLDDVRAELAAVFAADNADVRVIFSMREEFFAQLSMFEDDVPGLFANYHRLRNPDVKLAQDIVLQTCGRDAVDRPGLGRLVSDLARIQPGLGLGGRDAQAKEREPLPGRGEVLLPYLQLVCKHLWNAGRGGGKFLANYASLAAAAAHKRAKLAKRSGEPDNLARDVVDDYFAERMKKLDYFERGTASSCFDYLITSHGAKVPYELKDLAKAVHEGKKSVDGALTPLAEERVLKKVERQGGKWFELYHDMYAPVIFRWKARFDSGRAKQRVGAFVFFAAAFAAFLVWNDRSDTKRAARAAREAEAAARLQLTVKRALELESQGAIGEALLFRLRALEIADTEQGRREAGRLAGEFDGLVAAIRQDGSDVSPTFQGRGDGLVTRSVIARKATGIGKRGDGSRDGPSAPDQADITSLLQVWDAETGTRVGAPVPVPSKVKMTDVSADKSLLASVSSVGNDEALSVTVHRTRDGARLLAVKIAKARECRPKLTGSSHLQLACYPGNGAPIRWLTIPLSQGEPSKTPAPDLTLTRASSYDRLLFSPDGHLAWSVTGKRGVELWELGASGPRARRLSVPPPRRGGLVAAFSADSRTLSWTDGDLLTVVNAEDGKSSWTARLPEGDSSGAIFHTLVVRTGGDEVLVWTLDARMKTWDHLFRRGKAVPLPPSRGRDHLIPRLISAGAGGWLRWVSDESWGRDLVSGESLFGSPQIVEPVFNLEGSRMMVVDRDVVRLWDASIAVRRGPLVAMPDRRAIALSAQWAAWREPAGTAVQIRRIDSGQMHAMAGDVREVLGFMGDGSRLVVQVGADLMLADPEDKKKPLVIKLVEALGDEDKPSIIGRARRLLLQGETNQILVQVDGDEVTQRVIEPADPEAETTDLEGAFSPDERYVVHAQGKGFRLLRCDDLVGLDLQGSAEGSVVAFSPGSDLVLARHRRGSAVWRTADAGVVQELPHQGELVAASFNDDSSLVAVATEEGELRVWKLRGSQSAGATLKDRVVAIAFAPDGRSLLVATSRRVHLFGVKTDTLALTPEGSRALGASWSGPFEFTNDGGVRVVVGLDEGAVRPELVRFDRVDAAPLAGSVQKLEETYQKKLGLRLGDQEVTPVLDVRAPDDPGATPVPPAVPSKPSPPPRPVRPARRGQERPQREPER